MLKPQISIERRIVDDKYPSHAVIVVAVATIRLPHGEGWVESELISPGLEAVERDSDENYLEEVFREERAILITMLESLVKKARSGAMKSHQASPAQTWGFDG